MGGTGVATLVKTGVLGPTEVQHKPLGLGSSGLPHQTLGIYPRGPRNLQRQWTTAKPRDTSCNVLPFFLDLSLAFAPGMEFFDTVKSTVDSEVVFQATLQVPAHHALACRLNAYGTPFAAPDLQAAELRDEDLEFAACLATPPDLDEQLSVNFGRVMSMLEKNQGQAGGQIATRAAQARPAGPEAGTGSAVQQLRATGGATQTAPKVLVSVDEAETTAVHLQRANSGRKQPRSLMDAYSKRALQAMLGLGYLLAVLHEKTLGGRMEFTAALTAASIISPAPSGSHHRPRKSSGMGEGLLASLRQLMRDCPSLSPTHSAGRAAVAAAAAAAAEGGMLPSSGVSNASTPLKSQGAASFEAAWDKVVHPPLGSLGSSSIGSSSMRSRDGASRTPVPACQGLQLQLSISAPCRMRSISIDGLSTPGSTPRSPLSTAWQQQQQQLGLGPAGASGSAGTAATGAAATAAAAAGATPHKGSPLAKASWGPLHEPLEEQGQQLLQDASQNGTDQGLQQQEQEQLHKTQNLDRNGSMEALLDFAVQQMQQQRTEPSATDLTALAAAADDDSAFAKASEAPAAAAAAAGQAASPPLTPLRPAKPPLHPLAALQQQQTPTPGVRSFYLADQGPLTSPYTSHAGGPLVKASAPFGSPWVSVVNGTASRDSSMHGSIASSVPDTPSRRMLLPVMSMRLTCQPAWQYSAGTGGAAGGTEGRAGGNTVGGAEAAKGAAAAQEGRAGQAKEEAAVSTAGPLNGTTAAAAGAKSPSLTLAGFIAAADAADGLDAGRRSSSNSSGLGHVPAVHMHQPTQQELLDHQRYKQQQRAEAAAEGEGRDAAADGEDSFDEYPLAGSPMSYTLPQGLWPTMSFSLVPIRLPGPSAACASPPKGALQGKNASCLA